MRAPSQKIETAMMRVAKRTIEALDARVPFLTIETRKMRVPKRTIEA